MSASRRGLCLTGLHREGAREHMIRVIRISSTLALVLACLLLILSAVGLMDDDPKKAQIRSMPSVFERIQEANQAAAGATKAIPPMLVQAEAFAAYLNRSAPEPARALPAAALRPAILTERLKLLATSYCPSRPDKSMALISEPGFGREGPRWVKIGSRFSSFVVHEVRPGVLVYREGGQLRELAVEHSAGMPSVVRDVRDGAPGTANLLIGTLSHVAQASAGPGLSRTANQEIGGPRAEPVGPQSVPGADANAPRVASTGWAAKPRRSHFGGSFRSASRSLPVPVDPNSTTNDN